VFKFWRRGFFENVVYQMLTVLVCSKSLKKCCSMLWLKSYVLQYS